ncbi:hypothetical protein GCM10020370_41070 [Paenibacillus hodogayensis]
MLLPPEQPASRTDKANAAVIQSAIVFKGIFTLKPLFSPKSDSLVQVSGAHRLHPVFTIAQAALCRNDTISE